MPTMILLDGDFTYHVEESYDDVKRALAVPDDKTPETHHAEFNLDTEKHAGGRVLITASRVVAFAELRRRPRI